MKRIFLLGVIAYSLSLLLLNHWPAAVGHSGVEAAPWMAMMLVDGLFIGSAFYKMVGPAFLSELGGDEDGIGLSHEDLNVPDAWFYGIFGVDLVANFGWHAYKFAVETGATSFGYSLWFMVEAVALFLTFVFFKHAQQSSRRARIKATTVPFNKAA